MARSRVLIARATFRKMQQHKSLTVLMFILLRASQLKPFDSITQNIHQHAKLLHSCRLKASFSTTVRGILFPIPSTSLDIAKHLLSHTLILANNHKITALAKANERTNTNTQKVSITA